ncbi:MAG: hydroxyisourate hydrolase [Chloroflexota bacterium]|nr:hydroxyisourate hydrolase [Chloroflexota bacterium]
MSEGPTISTHVLDVERGQPAAGVAVDLFRLEQAGPRPVGGGTTDDDGRIRRLLEGELELGDYQLRFLVDGVFFRNVSVTFHVADTGRSYHVPLIVAPFSVATYRGS